MDHVIISITARSECDVTVARLFAFNKTLLHIYIYTLTLHIEVIMGLILKLHLIFKLALIFTFPLISVYN